MAYSEDHIALAAEYVLGTLDATERAQAEAMMAADAGFKALVEALDQKFAVLNQMVGSVEPRDEIWEKIRAAIGLAGPQQPLVLPGDSSAPVAPEAPTVAAAEKSVDASNVVALSLETRRWRSVARVASALAAASTEVASAVIRSRTSSMRRRRSSCDPVIAELTVNDPVCVIE